MPDRRSARSSYGGPEMTQGSMRRAAVLVATLVLFGGAVAQSAQAVSWTPVIKGAGAVTHAGYACAFSVPAATDPINSTSTSCPLAPLDTDTGICTQYVGAAC